MAVIGQQAFILAPTTDKYLSLANEEYVRKLDLSGIGNNWTKIRIGVHMSIANTGGGTLNNGTLFIGLCSGTTFPYQSRQTVNAVGYCWGAFDSSQNWTNAGGANPYYSAGFSYVGLRKVGQSILSATLGSATWAFPSTGGTTERRGFVCADIQQAATQVFPGGKTEAVASVSSDVWYSHFLYGLNQSTTSGTQPVVLETTAANNGQTLTPGAGWNTNQLDTVNIYWGSSIYALRIYAIAVMIVP